MLAYNELKEKTLFIKDGEPYEVLEYSFVRMQQAKPVAQLKIRNLITGKTSNYTAHQNEQFQEAEIEKMPVKFLYAHRGQFWFCQVANLPRSLQATGTPAKGLGAKNRFVLNENIIGNNVYYLKPNLEIKALKFREKIINIELPIKIELEVVEAPPSIKGNTAQGGTKLVILETDLKINVPFFIKQGDIVKINTTTGEYVERVQKNQGDF